MSHYFLDQQIENHHFILGVCSPDLISIFNREVRFKARKIEAQHLSSTDYAFLQGVLRHFEVDAVFHSCQFFEEETQFISLQLKEIFGDVARRRFFVAHILLELLIDKILIAQNPNLVDDFYLRFEKIGIPPLVQMSEALALMPLPSYDNFLEKFLSNQYLYHYSEAEYICFVLKRLLHRVHIEDNHYIDTPEFLQLLEDYEKRLEISLPQLFDFLSQNIKGLDI
ncbi:MAG: hypothetical protein ACKVTZ_13120 [Bacteroidia bacterium]